MKKIYKTKKPYQTEAVKKKIRRRKNLTILCSLIIGLSFPLWHYIALKNEIGNVIGINSVKAKDLRIMEEKTDVLKVLEGTKMEMAIPEIRKTAKYYDLPEELFVGIAFAESSFNRFNCFNPFGIGNNNTPRCYENWEHSINGFAQLIKFYYFSEGKFTAEQLVKKYVGRNSLDWVRNVKTYYNPELIIK